MVTVVDAETLIFSAEEDCRNDVAADEDEEADVVDGWVVVGIEYGEANQTCSTGDGEEQAEYA